MHQSISTHQRAAPSRLGRLCIQGLATLIIASAGAANAQSNQPRASEEFPFRVVRTVVSYDIRADGSYTETRTAERQAVTRPGIDLIRRDSFSFSTSAQRGEILEAYTLKPDGRRVDVRPDSYQLEVNKGVEAGKPAYSDRTTLSVVFPGVDVGDTVVFKTRTVTHTPIFPGFFSEAELYGKERPYGEAIARFEWPQAMTMRYQVNGCEETEASPAPGNKAVAIRCTNHDYKRSKRRDWSVVDYDKQAGILISSHPDYASIADAYWKGAAPKLVVSDRIRKLAKEAIAQAATTTPTTTAQLTPKQQTIRALYEWVSMNIGYAGNCVGVGTHVPRDLDWILDNRLGDCKDHALLLQAMLEAEGIPSQQALVNAGSGFFLAKVPVVGLVNHVINYIPSEDMFLDSTATGTPFGMLPQSIAGKPALLTQGFVANKTIPTPKPDANWQKLAGVVTIKPDGTATGDVSVKLGGLFATSYRDMMRDMTPEMEKRYFSDAYDQDGSGKGWAKLAAKDDPRPLLPVYNYQMQFNLPDFMRAGTGGIGLHAPIMSPATPLAIAANDAPSGTPLIACMGARSTEEVTFVLPANRAVIAVPKNVSHATKLLKYEAKYKRVGNKIVVTRTYIDNTPGPVCDESIQAEYRDMAKKVEADARAQLLHK